MRPLPRKRANNRRKRATQRMRSTPGSPKTYPESFILRLSDRRDVLPELRASYFITASVLV